GARGGLRAPRPAHRGPDIRSLAGLVLPESLAGRSRHREPRGGAARPAPRGRPRAGGDGADRARGARAPPRARRAPARTRYEPALSRPRDAPRRGARRHGARRHLPRRGRAGGSVAGGSPQPRTLGAGAPPPRGPP